MAAGVGVSVLRAECDCPNPEWSHDCAVTGWRWIAVGHGQKATGETGTRSAAFDAANQALDGF